MRITVSDLRRLIESEALLGQAINEVTEHIYFKPGEIMQTIRQSRVTPLGAGKYVAGEDTNRSRKAARPRGSTSAILPPGTDVQVLSATQNTAWVVPLTADGELWVDPRTGLRLEQVNMNINMFCPACAAGYTAGRAGKNVPVAAGKVMLTRPKAAVATTGKESEIAALKARIAELEAQMQKGTSPSPPDEDFNIEFEEPPNDDVEFSGELPGEDDDEELEDIDFSKIKLPKI